MITTIIAEPISAFGATPIALIVVFTLMNLFWFFGVHPNTILMVYVPILTMAGISNQEAFLAGKNCHFMHLPLLDLRFKSGSWKYARPMYCYAVC